MIRSRRASASASSRARARLTLPAATAAAFPTSASSGARPDRRRCRSRDVLDRERTQRQQTTAGAHRRQYRGGRIGDQQQQAAPRRLLENLEQGIGAVGVQFIDGVDDRDPPAALPGGRSEERDRSAHVVDLDVLAQLAGFFVDRALENQQIALCLGGDAPGDWMLGVKLERGRGAHRRRARIRMGEDKACHPIGKRRLADAGSAADQPGMRQAPAAIGREQRLLRLGVTVEHGGFARVRRCGIPVRPAAGPRVNVGLVDAHVAMLSNAIGAVAGSSRSWTTFQMRSATAGRGSVASINTQRCGSPSAIAR